MDQSEIKQELESLLNFNPPTMKRGVSYAPESEFAVPLSFYDKHLGDKSKLKRVKLMPSLVNDIAACVDDALKPYKDLKIEFPPTESILFLPEHRRNKHISNRPIYKTQAIADVYRHLSGLFKGVASTLLLYPNPKDWNTALDWKRTHDSIPGGQSYAIEDGALRISHHFEPDAMLEARRAYEGLTDKTIAALRKAQCKFPDLATWEIVPMTQEAEGLLENMSSLSELDCFDCENSPVITNAKRDFPIRSQTLDATETPWTIPGQSTENSKPVPDRPSSSPDGPWRNTRSRMVVPPKKNTKGKGPHSAPKQETRVSVLTQKQRSKDLPLDTVTLQRFVQHAWGESTRKDTTIIVFKAGNLERIGIRHRESQTLCISELIHADTCKDPGYGKLHIGLYMAALTDTMNRLEQGSTPTTKGKGKGKGATNDRARSKKRALPLDEDSPAATVKRRRTGVKNDTPRKAQGPDSDILKAAGRCELALVYLDYGVHGSSVPASLSRLDPSIPPARKIKPPAPKKLKRSYAPHEYITLIIGHDFARGGTGVAHEAKLELHAEDGRLLVRDVVVKLAFTPIQRQRLWQEYSIYHLLSSKGVSGILTVVGLYESIEDGVSALVMTRGGPSLRNRPDGVERLSPAQKTAFVKSLKEIHAAGVRHGDIRAENLLADEDGDGVAIIDFDRAKLDTPPDRGEFYESAILRQILEGDFVEGPATT